MKKTHITVFILVFALILALYGCGAAPQNPIANTQQPEEVSEVTPVNGTKLVSTTEEFFKAIEPGAVIELAPGTYDITGFLREHPNELPDYVGWTLQTDGLQAEIRYLDGLTLRGSAEGTVEITAEPRYADVLYFTGCSNITIENITLGHTPEQGNCAGAVLEFDHCSDISLNALDLYGCGTYGVSADHTTDLSLKDSIIRDCSYGIVNMVFCSNITASGCSFTDNSGYDLLSLYDSFVLFSGCGFNGNTGDQFLSGASRYGNSCGARFEKCSFGAWESGQLTEELKGRGNYVIGDWCTFDGKFERNIVHVTDARQLIESIAPDTQIMLAPGRYDIGEAMTKLLEENNYAPDLTFVQINDEYAVPALTVTAVEGLVIASGSGSASDTEIVTDSTLADVIRFENCSGIGIMDVTMGHTEQGDCLGDVLYFFDCSGTVLRGLDLYGCGVYGIGSTASGRLSCFDSTIRDCKYGAIESYAAQQRQLFMDCIMTGSESGGYFYADTGTDGELYLFRCLFGEAEYDDFQNDKDIRTEECRLYPGK